MDCLFSMLPAQAQRSSPKFKHHKRSSFCCFLWGGFAPPDPPSSRLLSQPPQAIFGRLSQVGRCRSLQRWEVLESQQALDKQPPSNGLRKSMHELSLSVPKPILSLRMLILATTSVFSQRDGFRQPYSNFSNRPYPHVQNRGTILMGIAVW